MSRSTTLRRGATALGASTLIALSLSGPASARPLPGTGSQQELACAASCFQGGATTSGPRMVGIDDNTIDYLQLGGGLLAGIALAGAGVAVASRRGHTHLAHPA